MFSHRSRPPAFWKPSIFVPDYCFLNVIYIYHLLLSFSNYDIYNVFDATVLFLYPLKTSENLWFSDVFMGYSKGRDGWHEMV